MAALTDQLTSIDSLYCEYSIQYGDSASPVKSRYARSGIQWHGAELSLDEQRLQENTFSYDGHLVYGFVVRRQPDGPDDWSTVQLQDPRDQENLDPEALLGGTLSNVSRSIVDALELAEVTKSEATLPDGTVGIRLLARAVPTAVASSEELKYDVAVTLDPKHGLLPAEILITPVAPSVRERGPHRAARAIGRTVRTARVT